MIEKVNPGHPDKVADRIAGALVDYAYTRESDPRIAVEVLIGHGECKIIAESSVALPTEFVEQAVQRIAGEKVAVNLLVVPQDGLLAANQREQVRCGDNGIFKGLPLTDEEKELATIARQIYRQYPTDGKYVLNGKGLIICQSHADSRLLTNRYNNLGYYTVTNPLGEWSGGVNVDSGATNRKLGSDMGHSVTGGGLHGKDLSKADVSVNIYAFLKAQRTGKPVNLCCAIGDEQIDGLPYAEIVEQARAYVRGLGGFERLAEWGLVWALVRRRGRFKYGVMVSK